MIHHLLGIDPTGCLAEKGTVVALLQEILLRGRRVVTSGCFEGILYFQDHCQLVQEFFSLYLLPNRVTQNIG